MSAVKGAATAKKTTQPPRKIKVQVRSRAQITQDEINADLPEFKMTDEERAQMREVMQRAKAGDSSAQRTLANWFREKMYKPIPDIVETPRISIEHRAIVAKKIAETGNNIGNVMLVTLLNYVLEEFSSFAAFARDPDSAQMIKDGVGPALQYAFKHRIKDTGASKSP